MQTGSAKLRGFEVKYTTAPKVTRSMRSALENLQLDGIDLIHAGERSFPLAKRIRAIAAVRILEDL